MTLSMEAVIGALASSAGVDEWIVSERAEVATIREIGAAAVDSERRDHRFTVTVFVDRRQSRGEASVSIDPGDDGAVRAAIATAVSSAGENQGPQWTLARPGAPARVALADPAIESDAAGAAAAVIDALQGTRRGMAIPRARVTLRRERIRIATSGGLDHGFRATRAELAATAVSGARRIRVATSLAAAARRVADLELDARLDRAARHLGAGAGADPIEPGTYDLILDTAALDDRRGAGFGWLGPLAAQASSELARRSLSRYQPGQSIHGADLEREPDGDPIAVSSDGALDFGWLSAPLGDRGEPVRRFTLVEGGRAASLALDAREAGLRDRLPNGGVRNLILRPGDRAEEELVTGDRPALIVDHLAWLEVDDTSGAIASEIAVARPLERAGAPARRGGHIAGDLFDWLARLRLGSAALRRPAYVGPRWIGLPGIEVW